MKRTILSFLACLLAGVGFAVAENVKLIPQPDEMTLTGGSYTFRDFSVAYDAKNAELAEIVRLFGEKIQPATGRTLTTVKGNKADITFRLAKDAALGEEGYKMSVTPNAGVTITAPNPSGIFYGMQTLMQLLPAQIKGMELAQNVNWEVPALTISDSPRFPWRGLMLDVSRHWFTKEEVLAYIDQLAEYKMNRFHWHLTDDQGWRLEIDALPRLTEIGAWRVPRVGQWWTYEPQQPGEATTYGGFYSKEDVAEVLEYARRRYVTVVPEIDVPGHSLAAMVAYPELACIDPPKVVTVGDKFYGIHENTLCVGKPVVLDFMETVFSEVVEMFPSEYIHIGGDEAFKGFWTKCPDCLALMEREDLKDVNELQSWFIRQVEQILKAKGRKIIGWDEIHEGGLAPEATVMSWRGMQGGIDAAKQGHHVIMTPNQHCYIDLYQGEPTAEPDTYSMCRLSDSYAFEPVPEGVDAEWIIGGQGNLWAESVPTFRHAEYMTWPRGWAIAEVLWSDPKHKDWENFMERVEEHFVRADYAQINHARSVYNAIVTTQIDPEGKVLVTLSSEVPLTIYYTFDNTNPDNIGGLHYEAPVFIPKNATWLTVVTYRDGKQIGERMRIETEELRRRAVKTDRPIGNL